MKVQLQNFTVESELHDVFLNQLVTYSKEDPGVRVYTRDAERFVNEESAKSFLQNAQVYTLIDKDKLNGIIWFSPKPLPKGKDYTRQLDKEDFDTTFAIRLYGDAKGKGLSLPFMEEVFAIFNREKEHGGIWLETKIQNERALSLYRNFGFEQVSVPDEETRVVMVYPR